MQVSSVVPEPHPGLLGNLCIWHTLAQCTSQHKWVLLLFPCVGEGGSTGMCMRGTCVELEHNCGTSSLLPPLCGFYGKYLDLMSPSPDLYLIKVSFRFILFYGCFACRGWEGGIGSLGTGVPGGHELPCNSGNLILQEYKMI